MLNPLSPLDLLARSAYVYRDKIAIVDGDRRFTYAQFNTRVHKLASALRKAGIVKGDRVAVLAPNTPMALEPHFAVPMIGAVLVMLNTRLQEHELKWMLNHCGAKALLRDPLLPLDFDGITISDYEGFLETASLPDGRGSERTSGTERTSGSERTMSDEDDMICINYTSGTTGFPKGVMFTYRGAYLNALGEIMEHGLSESSVYLWTVPMFHCNGWCFTWAVTGAGSRHIMLRQVAPARIAELIQSEGVTHLCGAPIVIGALTQYCANNGIRFEHGLKIIMAGAPPSPAVIRAAGEMGADIAHAYGLTETYGPHTICAWQKEWDELPMAERAQRKARQGVGYIVAGTDVRVVDADMNDVAADGKTMGEVIMRGNNVMLGYYNNPEATEEAFRGGWFHSGDLAVMHPDGYLEVRDRAKDIVISGGENISSIEVEKAIYDHPAVLEAAIVAMPDEKWGEVPKAFVTLKDGQNATAEEIIAFCRERLAHFKCPKHIEFGPLPKTATGKIRKNELRSRVWEGHERRVN